MAGERILVVEDDPLVAQDLKIRLEALGYVVPATAATEAAALRGATELKPDLVLMDIVLADEGDGIAAAARIRERLDIPVVYLTAYSDDPLLQRAKVTEPYGYIVKPYTPRELHAVITIALYSAAVARQLQERAQLAATLMALCDAIIATDLDGIITLMNPAAERMTGCAVADCIGRAIDTVVAVRDGDAVLDVRDLIRRASAGREPLRSNSVPVLIDRDGRETAVQYGITAIVDNVGKRFGAALLLHDDTARRGAEQALVESEQRFRVLAESTEGAIFVYRDRLLYVNPAGQALSGYTLKELREMDLRDLVHPDFRDEVTARIQARLRGEPLSKHYQVKIVTRTGEERWLELTAGLIQYAGAPAGLATAFDVTESKRSNDALRKLNRALKTLSACNEVLVRATTESELLNEVCRIIVEAGGYRLAWVGFAQDDAERRVLPVAQKGYEYGYLAKLDISWADNERGRGPTGMAIRTGRACVVQNIHADPAFAPWREDAVRRGYASSIALPLKIERKVIGALNLYAAEADAFDPEEIALLEELANDLAYGIDSLRTREAQRRSDAALIEAEEQYRRLVDLSFDMIAIGCDDRIAYINPAGARLLGADSPEALVGRPILDIVHPDDQVRVRQRILTVTRDGKPVPLAEQRYVRLDGTVIDVEVAGIPIRYHGKPATQVVVRDISARKRGDEARRRRQEGLERLDQWVRDLITAAGNRQRFYDTVCAGICDIIGADLGAFPLLDESRDTFTYRAAAGRHADVLVGRRMPLREGGLCGWVVEHGAALRVPDIAQDPRAHKERARELDVTTALVVPLRYDERIVGSLSAFRKGTPFDETDLELLTLFSQRVAVALANMQLLLTLEQRVAERTAELSAINQELEAFAYSVSHDLRAPLRSIDGFSQALVDDCGDRLDEVGRDHVRRVRAASQRMGELIDDLLTLSRVTRAELHRERVSLSALAREVAKYLSQTQPERVVEFVIAPRLSAEADARLMKVVLENLLGNAWKFTQKQPHARIEFGSLTKNGTTVYFVRDNGAGFDSAYAHKLFGAFQRLHSVQEFEGTGVGLATVQRIVHRHGGRVWAEGETDRGATFYFTV